MSNVTKIFDDRVLRVAYLDGEQRSVDARKLFLESKLKSLADLKIETLKSIEDLKSESCDLLIVSANHIPSEEFEKWLDGFCGRMLEHIWTPALVLASLDAKRLDSLLKKIVHQNWYFDIVDASHLDSLPIRVANLIRIHDHLLELRKYDEELNNLTNRLADIEKALKG